MASPAPPADRSAVFASVICAVFLAPFAALAIIAFGDSGDVWRHLVVNVLPASTVTTVLLLAGVGFLASAIGVGAAWIVSRYRFAGRAFLQWALVLPLAVPTYISAYCFVELLDYTGPVQGAIRALGGFDNGGQYWFPDIRSLPGAVFVMAAVLYPYVYLTSRIMFEMQAASILDMSRILGAGAMRTFFRVALPLARPAVAAGATLAMLEALNDIGAVEILGVRTLTFSVFDTWLNRSSLAGAAQISCLMLLIVGIIIWLERAARGARAFSPRRPVAVPHTPIETAGLRSAGLALLCLLPVLAGFVAPVGVLIRYAARRLDQFGDPGLAAAALNSTFVSLAVAAVTLLAAFALVVLSRRSATRRAAVVTRIAMLGYAVPGSVLAIGTLFAFTTIDNGVDGIMRDTIGISTGLLLSGTAAIVIYGCSVRFLAVAQGAIESGYSRISPHLAMVARTLGRSANQTLFEVELPLLHRALATGALLVFVETMKELSATVLLRPFGFSTLATFVYERASRARFEDAAIAALAIVIIGMVPILILNRIQSARRIV